MSEASIDQAETLKIPYGGLNLNEYMGRVEAHLVMQALERSKFNRERASRLLKIQRSTFMMKVKKYFPEIINNRDSRTEARREDV